MKVIDINDFREGEYLFAALAMCVEVKHDGHMCLHRWVAGVPKNTSLFKLECPECHAQDSFATILPSEYMEHFGVKR